MTDINTPLRELVDVIAPVSEVLRELRTEGNRIWLTVDWWEFDPRTADQYISVAAADVQRDLNLMGLELKINVHRRGGT